MKLQFLQSHLKSKSGYGESARSFAKGLNNSNIEVVEVDDEIKKDIKGNLKFPLIYYTALHSTYNVNSSQYSVIRTMFEADSIHPNWVDKFNRADAIWVPSLFNYRTFESSGVDRKKLHVVPDAVDDYEMNNDVFPLKTRKSFKFLSIFDFRVLYRKGVDILFKAYMEAFSEKDDVCLVIKTGMTRSQLFKKLKIKEYKGQPEIEIIRRYISNEQIMSLYNGINCYVLPSRGEGVGRPYMYAMLKELPVIATGCSGNTEFMNKDNSLLLKYKITNPISDIDKLYYPVMAGGRYADPDEDDLKEKMRFVYKNREVASKIGKRARKDILKTNSYAAVAEQVVKALGMAKLTKKERIPQTLFYHILPVFFPDKGVDIISQHNVFAKKQLRKVAIYGTGEASKPAYAWVKNFPEVKEILFCDRTVNKKRHLGRRLIHYKDIPAQELDLLLIGAQVKFVRDIVKRIKKHINIPCYHYY